MVIEDPMGTISKKIRALRKAHRMTQAQFGDLIGVVQSQVSKWERAANPEMPCTEHMVKIADLARIPLDEFIGMSQHRILVPIIGYIGAGAEMFLHSEADGDLEAVAAPEGATQETVAVEIRGGSLGETWDGWLVFYDRNKLPISDDMLGRLCVIGLADGRVVVKVPKKGQIDGLYNLHSEFSPPLYDQSVIWVSRITHLTPGP